MHTMTEVNAEVVLLRLSLEAKKIGMTELAKRSGLQRTYLYQALRQGGNPSLAILTKIALALGHVVTLTRGSDPHDQLKFETVPHKPLKKKRGAR